MRFLQNALGEAAGVVAEIGVAVRAKAAARRAHAPGHGPGGVDEFKRRVAADRADGKLSFHTRQASMRSVETSHL